MKVRVWAGCQVCLVVGRGESRISGCWLFLAVAEVQSRLVESIVEGKMTPASFLPSDGRADGRVLRADARACHPTLHQQRSLPRHFLVAGMT